MPSCHVVTPRSGMVGVVVALLLVVDIVGVGLWGERGVLCCSCCLIYHLCRSALHYRLSPIARWRLIFEAACAAHSTHLDSPCQSHYELIINPMDPEHHLPGLLHSCTSTILSCRLCLRIFAFKFCSTSAVVGASCVQQVCFCLLQYKALSTISDVLT